MKNKCKKDKLICPFTGYVCKEDDTNCYKCLKLKKPEIWIRGVVKSMNLSEQYRWERDIAIEQLESIGLSLGEKTDVVKDAIEKQIAKKPYQQEYNSSYGKIAPIGIKGVPYKLCPNCDSLVWGSKLDKKKKYCEECGQKLKWE